jgi:phage/plasmid primase-like uncharacterized protein
MTALDFNTEPRETIAELKVRADILDIIQRYATLKRRGQDWWGQCPIHADRTPSFQVSPGHQNFRCWGCGAHGDVIDFLAAVERLDTGGALARFRDLVGGAAPDPAAKAARAGRMAAAAALEAQETARRVALALAILNQSEPLTMRSPELPVRYLVERRGITRWQPHALRWHPACPWGQDRVGCLVVPVSNVAGDVTGIWRIRPSLDGTVERRGLGSVLGGCARVIDDAALPIIAVAEGVEDALSAWVLTTYPCWAALSTAGMAALELPAAFREVLICADADAVGLAAARALATRMRAQGREVRVIQPQAGKDANDVLQSRSAA